MVTYVYRTYVDNAQITSMKRMKALLREILSTFKACRIVVDGIDECDVEQQKEILSVFLALQDAAVDSCKIIFSSRNDESYIKRFLTRKSVISMRGQTDDAITLYAKQKINELSHMFGGLDERLLANMRQQISSEAKGVAPTHD